MGPFEVGRKNNDSDTVNLWKSKGFGPPIDVGYGFGPPTKKFIIKRGKGRSLKKRSSEMFGE